MQNFEMWYLFFNRFKSSLRKVVLKMCQAQLLEVKKNLKKKTYLSETWNYTNGNVFYWDSETENTSFKMCDKGRGTVWGEKKTSRTYRKVWWVPLVGRKKKQFKDKMIKKLARVSEKAYTCTTRTHTVSPFTDWWNQQSCASLYFTQSAITYTPPRIVHLHPGKILAGKINNRSHL